MKSILSLFLIAFFIQNILTEGNFVITIYGIVPADDEIYGKFMGCFNAEEKPMYSFFLDVATTGFTEKVYEWKLLLDDKFTYANCQIYGNYDTQQIGCAVDILFFPLKTISFPAEYRPYNENESFTVKGWENIASKPILDKPCYPSYLYSFAPSPKTQHEVVCDSSGNNQVTIYGEFKKEKTPSQSVRRLSSDPCFSNIEDNKYIEYSENSKVIENKKTFYLTEIPKIIENSTENNIIINSLIKIEKEIIADDDDISEYFVDETDKEKNAKFSSEEFFKKGNIIDDESIKNKDKIIESIREELIKGNLDDLLFNLTNGTKKDLLVQSKDIIYQITTTENQKKNEYKNISTINLNLCEERLKAQNNISEDESLIIFKVDYYVPGLLIPVIGYEVYHPTKNYKLELSNCSDILVNLNIPISINENTIFKHDPNSDYYTDECFSYTTEDGTDIILNDRYNEYNDNNLSICESNCTLNSYNSELKKAICECNTKTKIDSISDIINNDNIISSNFNKDNSTTNFGTMKCLNTLFSKEGLLSNLGSYLFIFNLCFFSISSIIYFKCGNQIIINILKHNKPIKIKKQSSQKLNIYSGKKIVKGKKRKKRKSKSMKLSNRIANPLKRISKKSTDNPRTKHYKREMSQLISSKSELKHNTNRILNFELKEENEIKINKKEKDDIKMGKYKNCELNSFPYKKALIYDKRNFRQIYFYLLLIKQPILFSFYPNDDYNLTIVKISLFFLSFDIYLVVNAFFFSKSKIHQIYEDGGNYNFSYFFPQIIYSFFISYIFISFIKYFSLSENYILEIKNEENIRRKNDKIEKVRKCLFIKYLLFYITSLVFIIIIFYYLSSFCAVCCNKGC